MFGGRLGFSWSAVLLAFDHLLAGLQQGFCFPQVTLLFSNCCFLCLDFALTVQELLLQGSQVPLNGFQLSRRDTPLGVMQKRGPGFTHDLVDRASGLK